jgi:hypothetical protein
VAGGQVEAAARGGLDGRHLDAGANPGAQALGLGPQGRDHAVGVEEAVAAVEGGRPQPLGAQERHQLQGLGRGQPAHLDAEGALELEGGRQPLLAGLGAAQQQVAGLVEAEQAGLGVEALQLGDRPGREGDVGPGGELGPHAAVGP